MPNYRYNTPDYMRRNNYSRQTGAANQATSCPSAACASNSCSSKPTRTCCDKRNEYDELRGMPIAMAYVPWQKWCSLYEAEKGLKRGTIFEELDKPFKGIGGCCR